MFRVGTLKSKPMNLNYCPPSLSPRNCS